MRLSISAVFLTFVLISVHGHSAPNKALPKSRPSNSDQNEFDEDPGPTKKEPTRPTYPNLLDPSDIDLAKAQTPLSQRGQKDLNFHLGTLGGNILTNTDRKTTQYFGIRYVPYETFEKSWDYTVNTHTEGLVSLSLGHRWHIPADEHFNSYYRVSFENFIDSGDGLAGLIHLRHMKIMASFGVPDLFEWQRRLTGEIGAGYGLSGFASYLQMGYNFNF